MFWRARVVSLLPSQHSAYVRVGVRGHDQIAEKLVVTDYRPERFAPLKKRWSLWSELFNNAEGFLAQDAMFDAVSITYHRTRYSFLFWKVDAVILYFLFTFFLAFVLKGFVNVII